MKTQENGSEGTKPWFPLFTWLPIYLGLSGICHPIWGWNKNAVKLIICWQLCNKRLKVRVATAARQLLLSIQIGTALLPLLPLHYYHYYHCTITSLARPTNSTVNNFCSSNLERAKSWISKFSRRKSKCCFPVTIPLIVDMEWFWSKMWLLVEWIILRF